MINHVCLPTALASRPGNWISCYHGRAEIIIFLIIENTARQIFPLPLPYLWSVSCSHHQDLIVSRPSQSVKLQEELSLQAPGGLVLALRPLAQKTVCGGEILQIIFKY